MAARYVDMDDSTAAVAGNRRTGFGLTLAAQMERGLRDFSTRVSVALQVEQARASVKETVSLLVLFVFLFFKFIVVLFFLS